jgi:hypothetical protein
VLVPARITHNILIYVREQLIGCDIDVDTNVGFALKPLKQVPGEYSMSSAPVFPFLRHLVPQSRREDERPGFEPVPRCNTIVTEQLKK